MGRRVGLFQPWFQGLRLSGDAGDNAITQASFKVREGAGECQAACDACSEMLGYRKGPRSSLGQQPMELLGILPQGLSGGYPEEVVALTLDCNPVWLCGSSHQDGEVINWATATY
jgi:hypothetical protein